MRNWIRLALPLLMLLLGPTRAFAWGEEAHRMVCGIAWQRLTPQTHAVVARLLGADDQTTFIEACLWADQVRNRPPETRAYHFINIPAGVAGMDMARDCDPHKHCLPWAIMHYARILADTHAREDDRRDALRFLIHFVADVHQPLHVGRARDRGGNNIYVDWFGNAGNAEHPMNLHSVWDTQILKRAKLKWPNGSNMLSAEITPAHAQQWATTNVVAWTNESYRLCEDFVYSKVPQDGRIRSLYYQPALGYAEQQLEKAGVRVAFLLNQVATGTVSFPNMQTS